MKNSTIEEEELTPYEEEFYYYANLYETTKDVKYLIEIFKMYDEGKIIFEAFENN